MQSSPAEWLKLEGIGMAAEIRMLHTAPASETETACERARAVHPSNFKRTASPEDEPGMTATELQTRFDRLLGELLGRGVPEDEARTEVARIVAREVWDGFASRLRRHRASGQQMDANVLAVALGSIQCMAVPLAHHRGDLVAAGSAVGRARRRLQHNGGLMDRLHTHTNPAFREADALLQALEEFLAHSRSVAA